MQKVAILVKRPLIDQPTQNHLELPAGGTNKDKKEYSTQLACVSLSLGHLAAKL